jgi:hypothetical protein
VTFAEWLVLGADMGWCSLPVCSTHDGAPLTQEEEAENDAGGDPCVPVVRLWGEP